MRYTKYLLIFFLIFSISSSSAYQNILYILRNSDITEFLTKHHSIINMLISQAYHTDDKGKIVGDINTNALKLAQKFHIPYVAQLTNHSFDAKLLHDFLASDSLQTTAIQDLIQNCQKNHLDGIHVDFEHLLIQDKNLFIDFIKKLSLAFHQAHLELSVAVIPEAEQTISDPYLQARHRGWSGGYNLSELAKYSDFITLMSYDQHNVVSTPGPIAGYSWVKATIVQALKEIPANKISLGIPTFSGYWKMRPFSCGGHSLSLAIGTQVTYPYTQKLIKQYHANLLWDQPDKVHYAMFAPDYIYRYLFIEDKTSFRTKLDLVKQYKLRGISIFRSGIEDPEIWNLFNKPL